MKDTELRSRLRSLGMPAEQADDVTRQIRDRLHPIAAIAVTRAREHETALGMYEAYGEDGLAGYEVDQLSGLLKSIKKVAKTAVGTVIHPVSTAKKVTKGLSTVAGTVAPILSFVPGIGTALAVGATGVAIAGGALKKADAKKVAKGGAAALLPKKQKELADHNAWMAKNAGGKATKPTEIAKNQRLQSEVAQLQAQVNAEQGINISEQIATMPSAAVPTQVAASGTNLARELIKKNARPALVSRRADGSVVPTPITNLSPLQSETAGLLQTLLAQGGNNLMSPPAQSILADVAAEGVEQTPAGPSSVPSWVMPVGIAAAGGLLLFALTRGRKRA